MPSAWVLFFEGKCMLDEVVILRVITENFMKIFIDFLDVAITGGGPSRLVCAYCLAKAGKKLLYLSNT